MTGLENSLERRKIIHVLYNGLERQKKIVSYNER